MSPTYTRAEAIEKDSYVLVEGCFRHVVSAHRPTRTAIVAELSVDGGVVERKFLNTELVCLLQTQDQEPVKFA